MSDLSTIPDTELDVIAATEVMEWTPDEERDGYRTYWLRKCDHSSFLEPATAMHNWHPTTDRNQARLVVDAAVMIRGENRAGEMAERMEDQLTFNGASGNYRWMVLTPRQEVEAAIIAVRSLSR